MDAIRKLRSDEEDALRQRVWGIVDALPHRAAIREADARQWVDAVVGAHGEAAVWHAIRLNGFGGSEIGVLLRNYLGERADHGMSARDIVEAKLMRRAPLENTAHLRRGHENEEPHARRFWAKWGAQRDQQAYDLLKNTKGSHPWMRYSPDDVVRMPYRVVERDGRLALARAASDKPALWLIDYKAPSQVDPGDKIAFQYAAQLHQGAILCAEAGLRLDGMMLSQFDWAGWSLKDDVVPWDPAMGQGLLEAGDHYWEYVLRAELPPYVLSPRWEEDPAYLERMRDVARQYAALAALSDAAKEQADALRAMLMQPLADKRLDGARIEFVDEQNGHKLLTVSASKLLDKELAAQLLTPEQLDACGKKEFEYDAEAMARFLQNQGVDVSAFKRRKLDADKVFALAARLGMDAQRLVKEQPMLRVAPHIKESMREYLRQAYPPPAVRVEESREDGQDEVLEEAQTRPGVMG